ncbi:MAG: hypothetical protein KF721_14185 [Ignavibacteriaceae bacterium]|nr:hypothetical protein [Ignavibacteriaceae bacterium]
MYKNIPTNSRKLFYFLLSLIIIGCEDKITTHEIARANFQEFFIEKGSDEDTSYISLKGTIKNSALIIETKSWGIWETGLSLQRENLNKEIVFSVIGNCGTISAWTWAKVEFTTSLSASETDTLDRIHFTNFRDTITVIK